MSELSTYFLSNMKELESLGEKSKAIAILLDQGFTSKEVQEKAQCSADLVSRVKNSAIYQDWQRSQALQEMGGEGARVAIQTLLEVARSKTAGSQARVSAADKLLFYTGLKLDAEGNIEKTPSTMSAAELHERLAELQKEAMARAKPVNVIEGEVVPNKDEAPTNEQSGVDELLD